MTTYIVHILIANKILFQSEILNLKAHFLIKNSKQEYLSALCRTSLNLLVLHIIFACMKVRQ